MSVPRAAACLLWAGLITVSAVGAVAMRPDHAHACSLVGFSAHLLPHTLESSSLVAVGRLTGATQTRITLEVEEGLKGANSGELLTLSNRRNGLGADCSVQIDPRDPGWALPEEERVIAFLAADVSGDAGVWGPAIPQAYVFPVREDDRPFGDRFHADEVMTLGEIRSALADSADVPFEPGLEKIGPCNPAWFFRESLPGYARMSAAIAVGMVTEVRGAALTVSTEEVLRGDLGGTFTVNGNYLQQSATSCDLTQTAADAGGSLSMRAVFFLYPDEFGVADWRLAHWGRGAVMLDGDWVSHGLPTLQDIRDLLGSGVGTEPPTVTPGPDRPSQVPLQSSRATSESGDDRAVDLGVLAAGATVVGVAVGALVARRRRLRRH